VRFLREELHTLTGAYALDALDSAERDRFTRHLPRCPLCENEVRGLQETAARLGVAVAAVPPGYLRARVLTAAANIRQLPPETEPPPARARAGRFPRPAALLPMCFRLLQPRLEQTPGHSHSRTRTGSARF